jgi:hypothetical protein
MEDKGPPHLVPKDMEILGLLTEEIRLPNLPVENIRKLDIPIKDRKQPL